MAESVWRCSSAICVVLAATGVSVQARAEVLPSVEPPAYTLSWVRTEGAETCPSRRDLALEVEGRLGRSPFQELASSSIEIHVERRGHGYQSRVLVRDDNGDVIGRRLLESDDVSCTPIFSATALAVALLIDPEAALRKDAQASQAVARFDPPLEPSPASTSAAPAAPVEPAPSAPATSAAQASPALDQPRPAEPRDDDVVGVIAAEALVAAGLVPNTAPGAGLYAGARFGRRLGFSASAFYVESATASSGAAVFDVGLTGFALAASLDALVNERARLTFELGPTVGALHASVRTPVPIDPGDFWFVAGSLGLRAQLNVTSMLFVSLRGLLQVPLLRRGLFVEGAPDPVWRQPPLAAFGAFGAGLSFF